MTDSAAPPPSGDALSDDERPPGTIAVRVVPAIEELDAEQWDACAGGDDPFVSHAMLDAMEQSGSAIPRKGWMPQHIAIEGDDNQLLAVAPLYVKGHSYGEYVFDWSWADACQRAGMDYYPKLQCCVPFSPVPGTRLLCRPGTDKGLLKRALVSAMLELSKRHEVSSLHITFQTEDEWELCGELGMLRRMGLQYHWHNDGYQTFDDFLGALIARKRKAINKERRRAREQGVNIKLLRGDDIKPQHWDAFHEFYLNTIDRKWASAYLTRSFFQMLGEQLAERVVLAIAEDDGKPVAGALHLLGNHALYGRYYGSLERYRYVHFELCYYQAIELAIELGLSRVEAGAQGPHKIKRGYVPVPTYSAHWLAHPGLSDAVSRFVEHEREVMAEEIVERRAASPFREHRAEARR